MTVGTDPINKSHKFVSCLILASYLNILQIHENQIYIILIINDLRRDSHVRR